MYDNATLTQTEAETVIHEVHTHLQALSPTFRDVKGRLITERFLCWAYAQLQMEAATALDFLAYYADGTLTDRMLAYLGISEASGSPQ
jgi:hypothetical protein